MRLALAKVLLAATTATAAAVAAAGPAPADEIVTPGDFTGYGFDQCTAPSEAAMDAWLRSSPYLAVGIYIAGASRGCLRQPNLSAGWVHSQLAAGWRLLPITLGPQAWCTTRERYLHQVRISPHRAGSYARARRQGRAEATTTVQAARRLGISPGSTLWYDIEAFDTSRRDCRESALTFLSAWTSRLHGLGYVSGIYSSGASGIRMLDDARVQRPGRYRMPDRLWIGDWNGRATTASRYVRADGWSPHRRVHQYRGGHPETHGGVTIDVDSDWLDLGRGSRIAREPRHCGGAASFDHRRYLSRGVGDRGALVRTIQCLLVTKHRYTGTVDGVYDGGLAAAVSAYRVSRGLPPGARTGPRTWTALLSGGATPVVKLGSARPAVRRLQRALDAAQNAGIRVTGVFGTATTSAVRRYQRRHAMARTGVAGPEVWQRLQSGVR